MSGSLAVHGAVDEGFGRVFDQFESNWNEFHELGAGLTIYRRGRTVVDLWAGVSDRESGAPWQRDTPAVAFSVSKGVMAICMHMLAESGEVDLDAPVSAYWPEFAQQGKDSISVSSVMSHRAGLAYLDTPLSLQDVCDWPSMVRAIEVQPPNWPPDSAYAYHAVTVGFILGEVVRRVTGLSPGTFLSRRVVGPLSAQGWFGVNAKIRQHVATLDVAPEEWGDAEQSALIDQWLSTDDRAWRALSLDGAIRLPIGSRRDLDYNRTEVLKAEIPAAGLIISAAGLSRIYASTVGEVDGVRLLSPATVERATRTRSFGPQEFSFGLPETDVRWGEGFQLPAPDGPPLLGPSSFGHGGASGSLGFADADHQIGFGYINNRMSIGGDNRAKALVDALRECLDDITDPLG